MTVEVVYTKEWQSGGICLIEQHTSWLVGGFEGVEKVPEWWGSMEIAEAQSSAGMSALEINEHKRLQWRTGVWGMVGLI